MSNTPFGFGSRPSNRLDPFFDDSFGSGPRRSSPLDPLFPDPSYSDLPYPRFGIRDGSAFAVVDDARVDWKETRAARVFKADLPGRRKRGVNLEVDVSAVQISGQRTCKREKKTDTSGCQRTCKREKKINTSGRCTCKREKKTDTRNRVERVEKTDTRRRGEREKKTDTRLRVEREKTTETWHRVEREKTTETWHRVEREKKTETWHRLELEKKTDTRHRVAREKKTDSGEVLRRFRLPANVKADQVKVAMENRMLTVTVPKAGVKKPVKRPSGKSIKIYG